MKINDTINISRLFKLMSNDLYLHAKNIILVAATLILFLIFFQLPHADKLYGYTFVLYTGGLIIASHAFSSLHDSKKAYSSLTFPCSNLERFFSKWLFTSIAYPFALLFLFFMFTLMSTMLLAFIFNEPLHIINLLDTNLLPTIGTYIVMQSIVLLGSATFKNYVLIKTAFTTGCIVLVVSLFFWFVAKTFLLQAIIHTHMITLPAPALFNGAYFILGLLFVIFFGYITYLKITECEI